MPRALCLLGLLVALLAAGAPAHARALEVGIAADGLLLNGDPREADRAVAAWKRLGVDTVRLQVNWARVAPEPQAPAVPDGFSPANHEDAAYRWHAIDAAVERIAGAGLKPMLMLDGPPPLWASSRPQAGNPRYQPVAWHFGAFAAAAAQRYGAKVDEYILWNEPNLPVWLQPQAHCVRRPAARKRARRSAAPKPKRARTSCTPVSPHNYRYMVRSAYPAIKAADPRSTVLAGALAPTGANLKSRNANMRPLQFLRAFGCVDAKLRPITTGPCRTFEPAVVDGIAHHPHSTKHPPDEPYPQADNLALASLGELEKLLDALQAGGRLVGTTTPLGLWLDEYAYQTNPPDKLRGVTPGRQDRYLQQAAYLAWRHPRVRMLAQYLWHDEAVGGGKRYTGWQSGLLTEDGRPKPALAHFDTPFWVDYRRSLIWGQIRPGEAHDVRVQVRLPGSATSWRPLAEVRTAGDGTWYVRTPLVPFASYRAVSGEGHVSATMVAAPPSASSADDAPAPPGSDPLVERRTVRPQPGDPVPPSFTGLSIEYHAVPDYLGADGRPNAIFARLVRTLARAGNGPPTLRFGGDSTEYTWWNPSGAPRPANVVTDVTPAWMSHLALWQARMRTPLLLGLNLGLNEPARAAELAGAAAAALPRGSIAAFEIGNEPDLYPFPRSYWVGKRLLARGQKRPDGYDYAQYRDELDAHVAAVRAAAPRVPISGGGFAAASWDDHAHDLLEHQRAVRTYGAHSYPLQTCDPEIRRRGGARYIPKLLGSTGFTPIVRRMRQLVTVAASHGATVRVTEMNSAICGGLRGLSDTFASALWGVDVLFGLAEAGVRGVNFHSWTGSHYAPVEFRRRHGRTEGRVRPLFYGMLLFSRAAPAGSRLLPVGPNPPGAQLKTWATVDPAGVRRVVVVNKDPHRPRTVVLRMPAAARRATVERLTAPSLKSQNNARFAGQGYGGATATGALRGKRRTERVAARSGSFRLAVPAGSAALVTVPAR